MSNEISKYDDVIDSRDIIARIEELQGERQDLEDEIERLEDYHTDLVSEDVNITDVQDVESDVAKAQATLKEWEEENKAELDALLSLQAEAEGSPDWLYGEGLIRDSYFPEYAQQLAEDCELLDNAKTWPVRCIDWEQAARELKVDYFPVDFDGEVYWIRS